MRQDFIEALLKFAGDIGIETINDLIEEFETLTDLLDYLEMLEADSEIECYPVH